MITYLVKKEKGHVLITTLSPHAFPLTYQDVSAVPEEIILKQLIDIIKPLADLYTGDVILALGIRVYYTGDIDEEKLASLKTQTRYYKRLLNNIYAKYCSITNINRSVEDLLTKESEELKSSEKLKSCNYIRKANVSDKKKAFMVGDLETLFWKDPHAKKEELDFPELDEETMTNLREAEKAASKELKDMNKDNPHHRAYAAAFMTVSPGIQPERSDIQFFYADDYAKEDENPDNFVEKSTLMLKSYLSAIMKRSKRERRVMVIYFHNLSGFDGIIILRHLALN